MNEHQAQKIVELNTEETEQVVGGASPTPTNPAGHPVGTTDVKSAEIVRERVRREAI